MKFHSFRNYLQHLIEIVITMASTFERKTVVRFQLSFGNNTFVSFGNNAFVSFGNNVFVCVLFKDNLFNTNFDKFVHCKETLIFKKNSY